MSKKKYFVSIMYPAYASVEVEAESDEEAIEKANEIDQSENPPEYEIDFQAYPKFEFEEGLTEA